MANTIRLKRASGSDPSASDLVTGELAVRTDNGKLFTKKDDNSVAEISGGGIDDGDKGDITVSNSGATFTIDNSVITSAKIADGAIVNADINGNAGITGNKIANDTIVNANIDSAAAIDVSKLSGVMPLAGGTFSGDVSFDGATAGRDIVFDRSENSLEFADNAYAKFGTGEDLLIYHNGTSGFIDSTGNDTLFIRNGTSGGKIKIQGNSGEDSIICNHNGSVELYEDNTKRLETTDSGVTVTGTLVATAFTGPLTGNVTGNASGSSGSCTGNAATATALASARTIAGVSFDGTGNISLNNNAITNGAGYITATLTNEQVQDIVGGMVTGNTETGITVTYQDGDGTLDFVVGTLNQDTTGSSASCTGNAATATKLAATKTIAGVAFDGSANISLNNNAITNGAGYITATLTTEQVEDIVGGMLTGNTETGITVTYQDGDGTIDFVVGTLNQDTTGNAATATALETARNIGGVSFNGTANINLPGVNTTGNQNTSGTSGGFTAGSASNLNSGTLPDARFPSTLPAVDGSNLTGISAGATGGGSDEVFYENSQTVTTNYTITNGKNAMSAGPITINSGVTVTVGSGETLTIV